MTNARYFWASVVGFLGGVIVEDLYSIGLPIVFLFIIIGIGTWASSNRRFATMLAIAFLFASAGAFRVYVSDARVTSALDKYENQKIILEGHIVDEPDKRERTVRLTVLPYMVNLPYKVKIEEEEEERKEREEREGVELKRAPRVLVPVSLPAEFAYGDTVRVEGKLERPESFETDGARVFDYPNYLAARNIYYEISFGDVERIEVGGRSVRGSLFAIKQQYLSGLQSSLPEPHSSLAGGITVGDKRSLGDKLTDQFRRTGLVHIVVLSGYNITLIVGALMIAIRNAPLTWRFILGGGSILAFVLMTGASATGVRAGAMAILALLAVASYRKYAIDRALAITAVGMVLWNPHTLLYDPGFQLSILATIGLIHIAPIFERWLTFFPKRFELRSIAAATLGTQMIVLPLLLYQMGLLSFVSLPANLLVLPAIPLAMIFSFVAGVAGSIYGVAGIVVGIPAYILLEYSIKVTELLASVPFGTVDLPAFSVWWMIGVYVLSAIIWWHYRSVVQRRSNSNS